MLPGRNANFQLISRRERAYEMSPAAAVTINPSLSQLFQQ